MGSGLTLQFFVVILTGVLAAACPGVLESVQDRRVRYGFGLTEAAPAGTVLLGVQDCRWLGRDALLVVDGRGTYRARIVDCQQAEHRQAQPMASRGLVADTDRVDFDHARAVVVIQ